MFKNKQVVDKCKSGNDIMNFYCIDRVSLKCLKDCVYILTEVLFCTYFLLILFQERSVLMATSASITTQKEVASLSVLWLMSSVPVPRPASLQKTRGTLGW